MTDPVAVVGVGIVGPTGSTVDSLCDALELAAGTSADVLTFDVGPGELKALGCAARGFDGAEHFAPHELRRLDRAHQMAIVAAEAALAACGASPSPERCAVVVGGGLGVPGYLQDQLATLHERGPRGVSPMAVPIAMANSIAGQLAMRFGYQGPSTTINLACASGAAAIGEAMWLLRTGRADRVLAGGVEAPLVSGPVAGFARMEAMSSRLDEPAAASRPFDRERDGMVLGEGAAFLVLERAHADEAVFGRVLGYMVNSDAHHLVAPLPDGRMAAACMRGALLDAGLAPELIGHVNAHGTSTRLNDEAEAAAIRAVFGDRPLPVTANKGVIGHLIGAAGAMEAIATMGALRRRVIPPVANLDDTDVDLDVVRAPIPSPTPYAISNSFGFGGHNATLVLG